MAKAWDDVAKSDAYKAMSPDDQASARQQYFQAVVAPKIPASDQANAWQQFEADAGRRRIGTGEAFARGLGAVGAAAGNILALAGSAPAVAVDRGLSLLPGVNTTAAEDWMFNHVVDTTRDAEKYYDPKENEKLGTAAKVAYAGGNLVGSVPLMIATGGASAPEVAGGVAARTLLTLGRGAAAAQPIVVPQAAKEYQDLTESGMNQGDAARVTATDYATNTALNAVPLGLSSRAARVGAGAATMGAGVPIGNAIHNAVLPDGAQKQETHLDDVLIQAGMGAGLGLIPHAPAEAPATSKLQQAVDAGNASQPAGPEMHQALLNRLAEIEATRNSNGQLHPDLQQEHADIVRELGNAAPPAARPALGLPAPDGSVIAVDAEGNAQPVSSANLLNQQAADREARRQQLIANGDIAVPSDSVPAPGVQPPAPKPLEPVSLANLVANHKPQALPAPTGHVMMVDANGDAQPVSTTNLANEAATRAGQRRQSLIDQGNVVVPSDIVPNVNKPQQPITIGDHIIPAAKKGAILQVKRGGDAWSPDDAGLTQARRAVGSRGLKSTHTVVVTHDGLALAPIDSVDVPKTEPVVSEPAKTEPVASAVEQPKPVDESVAPTPALQEGAKGEATPATEPSLAAEPVDAATPVPPKIGDTVKFDTGMRQGAGKVLSIKNDYAQIEGEKSPVHVSNIRSAEEPAAAQVDTGNEPAVLGSEATAKAPAEAPSDLFSQPSTVRKDDLHTEPSAAQKEAGNYPKEHVKWNGLDISIETQAGTMRRGTDELGKPWEHKLQHDYGYIRRTEGADGEHVDTFIGPHLTSDKVFVVNQTKADKGTGGFDEHKVMLGFDTPEAAKKGYLANYSEGWTRHDSIVPMPVDEFKTWLKSGDTKAPAAEVKEKTAPITDFGEKIGGARKDKWSGYRDAMSEPMPKDLANATLGKLFPEPDYEASIGAGADPKVLAAVKALRDAIPAKPRTSYRVQRWGEKVSILRDLANDLVHGRQSVDDVVKQMDSNSALSPIADHIKLLGDLGHPAFTRAKGVSLEKGVWSFADGVHHPNGITKFTLKTPGKPSVMFDKYEHGLEAARTAIASSQHSPKSPAVGKAPLDVYQITKTGDVVIGKKVAAGKYVDLKTGFKSAAEAREYLKTHENELQQALEKKKDIPPERRSVNDPRIGADYRQGKDVAPDQFAKDFGFRGVEFGNWVEQGRRQKDLNNAFDSLHDLAGLIDVPADALSLNGRLSMAFGARGTGGKRPAAAHFEPGRVVINLTKENGAGSLGHEWWHALDNYFSKIRGDSGGMISKAPRAFPGDTSVRPEVIAAYGKVLKAINNSDMLTRSKELDKGRVKDYWSTPHELTARAFERYLIDKAAEKGGSNDYLANIVGEHDYSADHAYPYPTDAEAPKINEAFGEFFHTLEHKQEDGRTVLFKKGDDEVGLPAEQVQRIVAKPLSKLKTDGIDVQIVQHQDDLPEYVKREAGSSKVDGVLDIDRNGNATVWMVGDNMTSADHVRRTLAHEVVGHLGVMRLLGSDFDALVQRVKNLKAVGNPEIKALAQEIAKNYGDLDPRTEASEIVAHMAEKQLTSSGAKKLWQLVVDGVRNALGRLGLLSASGAEDIRALIRAAAKSLEGDQRAGLEANLSFSKENGKGGARDAANLLRTLAHSDDLFKYPRSEADSMDGVFHDIDPAIKVATDADLTDMGKEMYPSVEHLWKADLPYHGPSNGSSKKGYRSAYVFETKDTVWIDASDLVASQGGGSKLYAAVANYAHNAGKVFIGDPAGLSDAALIRRTENMLSSAMKMGTTDHLWPHEKQENPSGDILSDLHGIARPLGWKHGDDAGNLENLLLSSYDNVKALVPEIDNVTYNFEKHRFEHGPGAQPALSGTPFRDVDFRSILKGLPARFKDRGLDGLVAKGHGDNAGNPERVGGAADRLESGSVIGSATLKRAALIGTLLRGSGGEAGRRVLAGIGRELHGGLSPDLSRTFYKLGGVKDEPAESIVGKITQAIKDRLPQSKPIAFPEHVTGAQQTALGKIGAFVRQEPIAERATRLSQDWKMKLQQGLVDQFAPLKNLDMTAYMQARLSKGTDGAVESIFRFGPPKLTDGAMDVSPDGKGLQGVLSDLKGEHDLFFAWIAGNRAKKLATEGRENLFNPDEIEALTKLNQGVMSDGRSRVLTYADAHKAFNDYQRAVLDISQKAGLIDGESRHLWENDFYVPFYRTREETGTTAPSAIGGLVRQQAFKKLKGGQEPLGDLLSNTLTNWSQLLTSSMKNMAAAKALDAAEKMGVAEKIGAADKGSVWAMVDGQQQHYQVQDPLVLDALTSLHYQGLNTTLMNAMRTFKHVLTAGVTVSPTFRVRNLIRDSISAVALGDLSYNPVRNIMDGLKGTAHGSETLQKLIAGGGAVRFGSLNDGDQAAHAKWMIKKGIKDAQVLDTPEKVKGAFKSAWEWWKEVGDRGETINRAALYQQLRANGKNHLEASYASRDLMDFTMSGKWAAVRFLTQVLPFFNARLQGLHKLGRSAHANPARFAAVAGAVAMASAALYLHNKDDEDFKKLPDFVRNNYWWVRLGGQALYIPKPFEIGAMGSIVEHGTELAFGGNDYKAKDFSSSVLNILVDQLAMNPVPQMFRPGLEAAFNYDSFRSKPIDSEGQQKLPAPNRYNASTSAGAVALGRALGISPNKVEFLIQGYFGWMGTQALNVADYAARPAMGMPARPDRDMSQVGNWFAVGDLVKNADGNASKYVNRFYEQQKSVDEAYAAYQQARQLGELEEAKALHKADAIRLRPIYEAANQKMMDLNRKAKKVSNDQNMSSEDKAARLKVINDQKDRVARLVDEKARKVQ